MPSTPRMLGTWSPVTNVAQVTHVPSRSPQRLMVELEAAFLIVPLGFWLVYEQAYCCNTDIPDIVLPAGDIHRSEGSTDAAIARRNTFISQRSNSGK